MNFNLNFLFVVLLLLILILTISSIELFINKRKSIWCSAVPQGGIVILPKSINRKEIIDPIYIYNSKKINKNDIDYQIGYDENLYTKKKITEHIASKMHSPIKSIVEGLMILPTSSTPVNDLFATIGKGGDIMTSVDPMTTKTTKYKMLTSLRDDVEAFIANGKIYLIK